MRPFDQSARYAAAAEPGFVLTRLTPLLGLTLTFRRWFDTRTLPLPGGPDRAADLVMIADEVTPEDAPAAPPWLLIFEMQSDHDADKPKVLHLEASVFHQHARDTDRGTAVLPLPVFVYLQGTGHEVRVEVCTPTGRGFSCDPVLWEIAGDDAATTLAQVEAGAYTWGALFWSALMAGGNDARVIETWQRLREQKVPAKSRADVTYVSMQFAELLGIVPAWRRTLEGVSMTESAIANEMIELGAMGEAREAMREALRFRFPTLLTPDVERAIADQPSLSLLREWRRAVFTVATAEEMLAVLRR